MNRGVATRSTAAIALANAIAVGASLLFAVLVAWPASTQLTNGFSAYDTSARLVVEGADPARFYDDEWFRLQTIRLGFGAAQDIYNIPPAAALLLVPLAGLSPLAAKAVWTGLNLAFLAIALAILARICHWTPTATAGAVVLVTAFEPVQEEIHLGQAYALLLVLEALLAWAYLGRRDRWVGGVLAALLGFKAALLALPALLVAQKQWRAMTALAIALAAIVGLTVPVVGWAAWTTYVRLLFDVGSHPEIAVTAYQSVPGLVFHLFRHDPTWNPSPLLDWPFGASLLVAVAELALIAITYGITAPSTGVLRSARSQRFAAWAIVSIIASPASADYHYTLLIVPIALLVAHWKEDDRRPAVLALIVVGVALIAAPIPYKSPRLAAGAWAILAYPKLYGGLVLWGLALVGLRASRPAAGAGVETFALAPPADINIRGLR